MRASTPTVLSPRPPCRSPRPPAPAAGRSGRGSRPAPVFAQSRELDQRRHGGGPRQRRARRATAPAWRRSATASARSGRPMRDDVAVGGDLQVLGRALDRQAVGRGQHRQLDEVAPRRQALGGASAVTTASRSPTTGSSSQAIMVAPATVAARPAGAASPSRPMRDDRRARLAPGPERQGPGRAVGEGVERGVASSTAMRSAVTPSAVEPPGRRGAATWPCSAGDVEPGRGVEHHPDRVAAAEHGRARRRAPGEADQGLAGRRPRPRRSTTPEAGAGSGRGGGDGHRRGRGLGGRRLAGEQVDEGGAVGLAERGVGVVGRAGTDLQARRRLGDRGGLHVLGRADPQARDVRPWRCG